MADSPRKIPIGKGAGAWPSLSQFICPRLGGPARRSTPHRRGSIGCGCHRLGLVVNGCGGPSLAIVEGMAARTGLCGAKAERAPATVAGRTNDATARRGPVDGQRRAKQRIEVGS